MNKHSLYVGRVRKAQGPRVSGNLKKIIFPLHIRISNTINVFLQRFQLTEYVGVLCTWVKLFNDLQILDCESHKNAFGGQAPCGPAGGAIALPRPHSRYKGT